MPPHEVNPNKPDSPLSLMEGAAGVLCYLLVCRKTVTRTSRRPLLGLRGSARKLRGQQESATRRVDLNLVRVYRSLMQMGVDDGSYTTEAHVKIKNKKGARYDGAWGSRKIL